MKFSEIELPSNKRFGFLFTVIFLFLSLFFYFHNKEILSILLIIFSLIFGLITVIKPIIFLPLNKLWMRFGFILGMIISPLVIGFIFYIIFSPFGIITRLFGRDELSIKKQNLNSYWKSRKSQKIESNSFKNQF